MAESWGRYPKASHREVYLDWIDRFLESLPAQGTVLPFGLGRSYGDVCLNDGGALIHAGRLRRFISFDDESGFLRCEAGVSLGEIAQFALKRGWFLPVTPGTQFVTVGGAIANDVHGKNHHRAGTFGRAVRGLELARSDGSRTWCSPSLHAPLYHATIGGVGLTGMILTAEIALKRAPGPWIDVETVRFGHLDEFLALARESDSTHEYTVAWIDTLARGAHFGRGLFMRGAHSDQPLSGELPRIEPLLQVPIDAPGWVLNPLSMKLFNEVYYRKALQKITRHRVLYRPFFYPLDAVGGWNRLYGARGFFQFQCVLARDDGDRALRSVLERIARSGGGSFLAVIKEFGSIESPGLLSFPRAGITLALDVPHRGPSTLAMLKELDREVAAAGGAIYPAKDATMAPASFQRYFPRWREFSEFVDPRFSSSFWRRVTGATEGDI